MSIEDTKKCFQKWIDRLKHIIQANGGYFEGQGRIKGSNNDEWG